MILDLPRRSDPPLCLFLRRTMSHRNDVDAYVSSLAPHVQDLVQPLRRLILETAPDIQETIEWKIPFYTYKGLLCYINPKKDHLSFGLCYGAELSNRQGMLEGDGKEVRLITVRSQKDLRKDALRQILHEAMILNEVKARSQKTNKRNRR